MAASEQQIVAAWDGDVSVPLVSICCAAYNHEDYIAQTLESFLAQGTTFPFEILVHDDASTDGTADIIRRYAGDYPRIIRTVLQEENQYTNKPIIVPRFLFPLVRGRYTAFCEGDDYWCSPDKLARQVEALEGNPAVNLSYHPVLRSGPTGALRKTYAAHFGTPTLVSRERIMLGGGGFCPTPSLLVRSTILDDVRECVTEGPFSDYFLQIIASLGGGAVFLPAPMAVYRVSHGGSWSERVKKRDRLRQFEDRIASPFRWLYEHCDADVQRLLQVCEADQFARIGKQYLMLRDFEGARRALAKAARAAPVSPGARRALLTASRGAGRTTLALGLLRLLGFDRIS